jgi:hypothetical protein
MIAQLSLQLLNRFQSMAGPVVPTLFLVLLMGCSDTSEPAEDEAGKTEASSKTVHIATYFRAVDYAPFYDAQGKSFFEEGSPDVSFKYTAFDSPPCFRKPSNRDGRLFLYD